MAVNHALKDFLIVKENFFDDMSAVWELTEGIEYRREDNFPGLRSDALRNISPVHAEFEEYFVDKLQRECFPSMLDLDIDVRFHINDVYEDPNHNRGWIHRDSVFAAGIVYLSPGKDIDGGTTIYAEKKPTFDYPQNHNVRQEFNRTVGTSAKDYSKWLGDHNSKFDPSIIVGHKENRLVTYDSRMWHAPTQMTADGNERRTIIFFIGNYTQRYDLNYHRHP